MTDMAAVHSNIGALQPDGSIRTEPTIDAQHVARSIVHIAGLPLDVTVLEMNVM
jgi:NADP-dependent 3-hydroxy acid dehydrogenase YdfG